MVSWKTWSALALVGSLVGCNDPADKSPKAVPTAEVAQPVVAPVADAARAPGASAAGQADPGPRAAPPSRAGRGGGPELLLSEALKTLDLTAEQRTTIEGALEKTKESSARGAGPRDRSSFTALAEGVRAGKVDPAAVVAKIGAADAPADERLAAAATALQTLHKTLTKEQRRSLVDGLSKRMKERGAGHGDKDAPGGRGGPPGAPDGQGGPHGGPGGPHGGPGGPHGGPGGPHGGPPGASGGPRGGLLGASGGPRGGPPGGWPGGRGGELAGLGPVGFLLRDLDLTDKQREAIKQGTEAQKLAAPDGEAMKKRIEGMQAGMLTRLETFASDTFDARAFLAPPEGADGGAKQFAEHLAKVLAVVAPVLDPAQREKLADRLEKGPQAFGFGGPRGERGLEAR